MMKKILLIAALLLSVGLACSMGRNPAPTATIAAAPTLGLVPTEVPTTSPVPTETSAALAPTEPILIPSPTAKSAVPLSTQVGLPEQGEILLEDDFSTTDKAWYTGEEDGNSIKNLGGIMEFTVVKESWLIWTESTLLDTPDVVIEVDALLWDGDLTNNYGVMCRYVDEDNYYSLTIANDGYVEILKYVGGEAELLYGEMQLAGFDENLNHIAASCIGETLSLYVNGDFIASVEDSSLESGDVGLVVGTYDLPPVTVRFDNFIAYTPR
ncbi:MAG TPA: hypothetical protein PKW57_02395 [Anaerolineaceae bacterium]|nr:hypothetical protein [Anaerolineaceae bacterium]